MKQRSLLMLILLGGVFASCGEDGSPIVVDDGFPNSLSSLTQSPVPTYGQFYVTSTWTRRSNLASYRSGGQVYADTDHDVYVSGGTMVASGATVAEESVGSYLGFGGPPIFGATATWSLSGNPLAGIPPVSGTMYLPAEIQILSPAVTTVSRSQPLAMTWNVDPNNDSIMIRVDDISEPPEPYITPQYGWHLIVADNGSYTIPSSVLSNMPVGSLVKVSLYRGSSSTVGTTHKFHIYGETVGLDAYKLTP